MKKSIKKVLAVVVSIAVFLFLYGEICDLLASKDSVSKYGEFYQETGNYDVLFLGSSHMMNTIYPMELWKQYGITSYNMANSTEALPGSYWVLKNALDYTKPKVVVVDCFMSGNFKIFPNKESFSHVFYDTLPMSINKVKAIKDLLPEHMEEYLWSFSLYHNRWSELNKGDFKQNKVPNRGAGMLIRYSNEGEVTFTNESLDANGLSVMYIRQMKELCDENEIQLVLCCMPYAASENEQKAHNGFFKVADELGIEYLNFIPAGIVDYEIDMYDRGHLNISGARKITEYMGEWLLDNCDITPKYVLENWEKDYDKYLQEKCSQIKNQTDLYRELLMLHDLDFEVSIVLRDPDILSRDPILNKIINNITHLTLEYSGEETNDIRLQCFTSINKELIDTKTFNM